MTLPLPNRRPLHCPSCGHLIEEHPHKPEPKNPKTHLPCQWTPADIATFFVSGSVQGWKPEPAASSAW